MKRMIVLAIILMSLGCYGQSVVLGNELAGLRVGADVGAAGASANGKLTVVGQSVGAEVGADTSDGSLSASVGGKVGICSAIEAVGLKC